ncbi:MAG: hypothetical protein ABFS34_14050 [Gemmatimonadota bacterium]
MIASLPSPAARARAAWALAVVGLGLAAPLGAQDTSENSVPRAFYLALRVGGTASSALVEDAVGPGAGAVTAKPDPGPVVGASFWFALRPRISIEGELGWSATDLGADDGASEWTADDLNVIHGALLLRFSVHPVAYGRVGVGVLRYGGDRPGGFLADDAQVQPYATAGVGARREVGGYLLFAELNGQLHRFSFRALREAGGESGTVARALLQVGAAIRLGGAS